MSQLANRLIALRAERHWTQQDLAYRTGLALVTIARIESDHHPGRRGRTKAETLAKLAAAFDVDIEELFVDPTGTEGGTVQDRDPATVPAATDRTEIARDS